MQKIDWSHIEFDIVPCEGLCPYVCRMDGLVALGVKGPKTIQELAYRTTLNVENGPPACVDFAADGSLMLIEFVSNPIHGHIDLPAVTVQARPVFRGVGELSLGSFLEPARPLLIEDLRAVFDEEAGLVEIRLLAAEPDAWLSPADDVYFGMAGAHVVTVVGRLAVEIALER
jgi:hypothetical protein